MEIIITIKESENGKPSVIVKEGDNPKSNSKSSSKKPSKNQDSKEKSNSGKEKPEKGKVRTEKELEKRRKWLVELKETIESKIENGEGNLAEERQELGWLKTVIAEYGWILKETD